MPINCGRIQDYFLQMTHENNQTCADVFNLNSTLRKTSFRYCLPLLLYVTVLLVSRIV